MVFFVALWPDIFSQIMGLVGCFVAFLKPWDPGGTTRNQRRRSSGGKLMGGIIDGVGQATFAQMLR